MFGHSAMHVYLNWVKERIDEMDAALASLEGSARKTKVRSSAGAKELVAGLKKRRARFEALAKKHARDSEIACRRSQALLESEWKKFQADAARHLTTAGQQVLQRAAFRRAASAQSRAWRQGIEKLQILARTITPARRSRLAGAIRRMKAEAARAELRLRKLGGAQASSWSALNKAMTASREAFDRANRKAGEAIKQAMKD